ncbi:MAG: hypothetical protein ACFFDF_05290 [Candidatus Odinarchaeota archaeon]
MKPLKKCQYRIVSLTILIIISLISSFISESFIKSDPHESYSKNFEFNAPKISIYQDWNLTLKNHEEGCGFGIISDIENNIYVTGRFYNTSEKIFEILLMKYNNFGEMIWNQTWGDQYDSIAFDLCIDSISNIYVVGSSDFYGNDTNDIVLLKYSNNGELIWNRIWGNELWDAGYSIVIDHQENLYIAGFTETRSTYGEVIFLKYTNSGELVWNKTWGGIDTDFAYGLEIDSDENLYITGYTSSFGAETSDLFLIKCDNEGIIHWNITYRSDGPALGRGLAIDSLNNIYVVANVQNLVTQNDVKVSKINSSGTYIWNFTYSTSKIDVGYAIDLDSKEEHIFITGYSDDDAMLIKLNQSGSQVWVKYWGGEYSDTAYGITNDYYDNIFITGQTENSHSDLNLFIVKFSPIPNNFELNSGSYNPNPTGNFTLTWITSLDAANYSLYQSDIVINEITSSETEIESGNTNQTYSLYNLEQGIYYFKVLAFNEYGNTSSNCLKIKVQYPPSEFYMYKFSQFPNTNGIINLTWSDSIGADNYSVYVDDTNITDIISKGSLVEEGLNETFIIIENLTNGDYYYAILAVNEAGKTLSNCTHICVRRAPTHFGLTSSARTPSDDDGTFELIWTNSEYAQNYTVYFVNHSASTNVIQLYNFTPTMEWSTYRYKITQWRNGNYSFQVIAYNNYGYFKTSWLDIEVYIPKNDEKPFNNYFPIEIINRIITYMIFLGALIALIFIYKKRK